MAQTGFTPIQIYSSSTTGNTPAAADLLNSSGGSELAINIFDGKLFYKDNANAVQVIGWKLVPVSAGGTGQTSYTDGQLLIGNSTGNTLNKSTLTAGTGITITNGPGAITINGSGGTVTNVAALTLGTTGTDLSSTVANSTTTPVITLNVPTASAVNRGALSAADWTTFNSKAPSVTFTSNYIPYGQGSTTLNQSAGLQFDGTNFTTTGSATATGFIPTSSTIPTNGMYLSAANTLGFATNSAGKVYINANGIMLIGATTTQTNEHFRLGIAGSQNAMLISNSAANNGTILSSFNDAAILSVNRNGSSGAFVNTSNYAADIALVGSSTTSYLVFGTANAANTSPTERMRIHATGGVSIGNTTDPGASNLSVTGIVTANNVRSNSTTITSASTITPTSDTTNQYTVTALAGAATIAIPSGTPIDGQKLSIRIKDNGTGRALTWTTSAGGYRVIGTTLPTTTTASKVTYVGCVYNSQDSFWDVLAVATQA
jgi:hypothetical protein